MAWPDVRPFADDLLDDAGALLAARHRAARGVEPLLPARYEDPAAARAEIAAAWAEPEAQGTAAFEDGVLVGYLIGAPLPAEDVWGANVWVGPAGHAVREPELVRDLYAAAAQNWVDGGRTCHYAMVPAADPALVDAWFRLGFGQQHVHALQAAADATVGGTPAPGLAVRRATSGDVADLARIDVLLPEHQHGSPVFSRLPPPSAAELLDEWAEDVDEPRLAIFVAEAGGRVVGSAVGAPIELSSAHSSLARPDRACLLGFAATEPELRGTGAGLALTAAVFEWARDAGYETIAVDYRATNLRSSRFWPARGFRETFLRLYRSVP